MDVLKRNGDRQPVAAAKLRRGAERLRTIEPALAGVDVARLADLVVSGLYDGVATTRVAELAATKAASLGFEHPDYLLLAGRYRVSALQASVPSSFSAAVRALRAARDPHGAAARW